MSKFVRAVGGMTAANALAALAGGVATLLGIRALAPEAWALTAVVLGLGPALGVVLSLGSVSYQARLIARVEEASSQRRLAAAFFLRRLIVSVPIFCFGALIIAVSEPFLSVGLILILGAARFVRGGASVLLNGQQRFGELALLVASEKLVYLGLVAVFAAAHMITVATLPVVYSASLLLYVMVAVGRERLPLSRVFWESIRTPHRIWSNSGAFGVASLSGPIQQLDVVIVGAIAGPIQAGYFAAGSRLTAGLNVAGSAMASVVLSVFARGQVPSFSRSRRRMAVLCITGCALIGVWGALIGTAEMWVPVLLGPQYAPASLIVASYLLAVMLQTANVPLSALLQAWSDERFVMWVSLGQSVSLLAALVISTYLAGSLGAAVAFLLVMVASLIVLGWRTKLVSNRMNSRRTSVLEYEEISSE